MYRIESLLSARLFLAPQLLGDRIFFVSNLSGRLSLYAMDVGGSVPEQLLPPHIALQNPDLVGGMPFALFPRLNRILVLIDNDGDENYQPMLIPLEGGFPEPAFGDQLQNYRVGMGEDDPERNLIYLFAQSRTEQTNITFRGDLARGTLEPIVQSVWGAYVAGVNADHTRLALLEGYTVGDHVLYLWNEGRQRVLYGVPLEQREPEQQVPINAIGACVFVGEQGLLCTTALFSDTYGLGYLDLQRPGELQAVEISGQRHAGVGELVGLDELRPGRYELAYNIDGSSWVYEGSFDVAARRMTLDRVVCGMGQLSGGVAESIFYDKTRDRYALAFSSATSPIQLYLVEGAERSQVTAQTRERVLGIPRELLAPGEDAAFVSHDGLRVSARLYLPAAELGFVGPRPLVYYIHGGPQSQERPDFAWFSMPLIQFLTLKGFAVFVPNARGSTGYGLSYTKHVDRDWGGQDRLDHVHAMTRVLPNDPRIDLKRAAVVGRSYGGYMTLTLASRHPELWSAACDMFGPYDLLSFIDRVPETWKPYFSISVGDPVKDRELLIERSPRSYIEQIRCPLLVIQGANDPRVTERESRDVVEQLRGIGKQVEFLLFENEGHDVLKFENRVTCYNAICDFFVQHLQP